jgi:hypothetical protein
MAERIILNGLAGLAIALASAGCMTPERNAIYSGTLAEALASEGKTEKIGAGNYKRVDFNKDGIVDEKISRNDVRLRVAGDPDIGASIMLQYSPDGKNFTVQSISDSRGQLKRLYSNLEVGAKGYDVSNDKGQLFQRIINNQGYTITESYQHGKMINSIVKDSKGRIVQKTEWNAKTHEYDVKFN